MQKSTLTQDERNAFACIDWWSFLQAVYGTLSEAEHRSTFYIPYWKFPLSRWLVPRQRKFNEDLKVINDCLDDLIKRAQATRQVSKSSGVSHGQIGR